MKPHFDPGSDVREPNRPNCAPINPRDHEKKGHHTLKRRYAGILGGRGCAESFDLGGFGGRLSISASRLQLNAHELQSILLVSPKDMDPIEGPEYDSHVGSMSMLKTAPVFSCGPLV